MDISTLERAAEALMAPPNLVSAENRKNAEQLFHNMKKELNIETATHVLQNTENQFILFQIAQIFGEMILREWPLLNQGQVEGTYKMLLEYVASRENLANYVISEFLRAVAMILKRGVLDKKTGEQEQVFDLIHNLLTSPTTRLQSVGCQLISSITEQFSSSWRNSTFSITWDFHLKAKAEFECVGLRRLLEMSLKTLHGLCLQSDILNIEFEKRLCEKFLEVAENIFSWNFSSKVFRKWFSINQTTNCFRPPISWKDLLENDEFFILFFNLHAKIRVDEFLSLHSLSCLVQLAGLSGDIMADQSFGAHFVHLFVSGLLSLFPEGPMPHEVNHFCTIINRLFLYRPVQSLMRLDPQLRSRFFLYLTQYMQHLTNQAMNKAIGESEHDDHSSLALLYDSWVILLRGRWRSGLSDLDQELIENELITPPTWQIVLSFVRSVQAPPLGNRPSVCEEANNEDSEDRALFNDLLTPLGTMTCYNVGDFMQMMTRALRERLVEFQSMVSGSMDSSRLPQWQEDMHWLMLILANSVVGEDVDGTCHVEQEIFDYSAHLCTQKESIFSLDTKSTFLCQCIMNEQSVSERSQADMVVDPFISLVGEVLAWSSVEHQLVTNAAADMISPELTRSTLLCLKRIINAASNSTEFGDIDPMSLPILPTGGHFAQLLVQFIIHKVFAILSKFSGEEKLCVDAVELLIGLIESRASTLAAAPELFGHLEQIDISRLPCRTTLMKGLVLIGAAANDHSLQENMYVRILEPLSNRFMEACQQPLNSSADSQLVDLLQCFDGVAKASQPHSASVLFRFLNPVLSHCVNLMKSRGQVQPIVSAILILMQDVTTKVSIYVEDKEDSEALYRTLLTVVDVYRTDQATRFVGMTSDDEDKANDLIVFLDILSNVLSKDILDGGEENVATGAQVAMASLEMLLSVMSEGVLQIPELALRFYRLILYLVEFSPEAMASMSADLIRSLSSCLKAGMTSQFGPEITSTSLEAFTEIASYFGMYRERINPSIAREFTEVIPLVFETCLENSCENSIFCEATSCLFSLICFDKASFDNFVEDLLSRKSNESASAHLRDAFASLFPDEPRPGRRERIAFRQRMEKFLNSIQGLLSYA